MTRLEYGLKRTAEVGQMVASGEMSYRDGANEMQAIAMLYGEAGDLGFMSGDDEDRRAVAACLDVAAQHCDVDVREMCKELRTWTKT